MFTGITRHQARLEQRQDKDGEARMCFQVEDGFLTACTEGDSIAVSGVCLTAVGLESNRFCADISAETLARTTLGAWQKGQPANLELSLKAGDRLGGHLVSGHVDGRAMLVNKQPDGQSWRLEFEISAALAKYIAAKGSVCLDGVSLTVNDVRDNEQKYRKQKDGPLPVCRFGVCVIPHTLEVTTMGRLVTGAEVNLEVDIIARYLERLQAGKE